MLMDHIDRNCVSGPLQTYRTQPQGFATALMTLEKLLFLTHLTAGQPGRGPEITSIRHSNSATTRRNIYIYDSQIMIVTAYHKS
jgi:hypothetical protein